MPSWQGGPKVSVTTLDTHISQEWPLRLSSAEAALPPPLPPPLPPAPRQSLSLPGSLLLLLHNPQHLVPMQYTEKALSFFKKERDFRTSYQCIITVKS